MFLIILTPYEKAYKWFFQEDLSENSTHENFFLDDKNLSLDYFLPTVFCHIDCFDKNFAASKA